MILASKRIRLVWQLTAALCVSIVAIAGLVVGFFATSAARGATNRAQLAADQANRVAVCVNTVLSLRNTPATSDATAHIKWAATLEKLVVAPKAEQQQDYQAFIAATGLYLTTLTANQANRADHPLGKC